MNALFTRKIHGHSVLDRLTGPQKAELDRWIRVRTYAEILTLLRDEFDVETSIPALSRYFRRHLAKVGGVPAAAPLAWRYLPELPAPGRRVLIAAASAGELLVGKYAGEAAGWAFEDLSDGAVFVRGIYAWAYLPDKPTAPAAGEEAES